MAFKRLSIVLRNAISSSSRTNWLAGAAASSFAPSNWRRSLCQNSVSSSSSSPSSPSASSYHLNGGPFYMRGVMFTEPNKPLSIEEFHMPRPKAGEVLIKTKACGVWHSDLHVIKGELPFASPCVVGHEITVGAHVVGAFIMPCGSCFFCNKGQDDLCEDFFAYNRAKGTLYDRETCLFLRNSGKPIYMYSMGGLADFCVVPAHGLCILPNTVPYIESAILGCAVFTAYGYGPSPYHNSTVTVYTVGTIQRQKRGNLKHPEAALACQHLEPRSEARWALQLGLDFVSRF
ncbi:hypothetical protein HYC85_021528 [Camellia sinensis]|uniref:Alcohol dehydrogenase-like N-terminal domain-containing protein n=1 Tax=Camellia sinensis TaxID=4442 RepID=A0A7J7GKE1_CAMSI|nr:hypothetical protein HYC85_021528 [Camellia sinensis]